MKISCLVVILTLMPLCLAFAMDDYSAIVEQALPSVVELKTDMSLGSGFVFNPAGYILTNYHVVQEEKELTAIFVDGTRLKATVIARDPIRDLAICKVGRLNLPVLTLGNSDNVKPGQPVLAIGNPMGMEHSITQGIISSTSRVIKGKNYIQVDAPLNPGVSGGPVLDNKGHVIGIAVAIMRFSEGIGFIIPINDVLPVLHNYRIPGSVILDHPGAKIYDTKGPVNPDKIEQEESMPEEEESSEKTRSFLVKTLMVLGGAGFLITLFLVTGILIRRRVKGKKKNDNDLHIELK